MEEIKQTWEERFDKQSNEKHFGIRSFIRSEIALAVKQERERINKFCIEEIEYIQNHSSGNYAEGMVESLLKVKRFNQQ